jgi:pimeloyl-ACP methyl ester carboxylesterase
LSLWRRISAPTLMVLAAERDDWHKFIASPGYRRRLLAIPDLQLEEVSDVGHMLHHDRPDVIASMIEAFLTL